MPRGKLTPRDVRQLVFDLWIQGYAYRKIKEKTGVGIATTSKIVKEYLKKDPELSELRDLGKILQKAQASHYESLRGAGLLEELNKLGVSLYEIGVIIEFYKTVKHPAEAAIAGLEINRLRIRTGKSYDELLKDYRLKEENLNQIEKQLEKRKKDLNNIELDLEEAEALKSLQEELRIFGLTPERLQKFVMNAKEVEKNGFTPEISAILSKEIKKHGLDPARAAVYVAELVSKHNNLRYAVESLTEEEAVLKRMLTRLKAEESRLEKSVNMKKEKIRELNIMADDYAKKILNMNTTIENLDIKKKETEEELGAKKEQIETTNAWRSYLLSGKMPSWDSTFWKDLNHLISIRNSGITDGAYLKPASEAVRKKIVELYREMVKKGLGDVWDALGQRDIRTLKDRLEKEKKKSKAFEEELETRKEGFERRVQEEVSNRLSPRIATKKCRNCGAFFWIDSEARLKKTEHGCPYCYYSLSGVENFPYNIFHYPHGKILIIAYLPNQKDEDIFIEPMVSSDQNWMVRISTRDRSHFFTVSLETQTEPLIQEKTYEKGRLRIRLQIEKPKEAEHMFLPAQVAQEYMYPYGRASPLNQPIEMGIGIDTYKNRKNENKNEQSNKGSNKTDTGPA